MTELEICVDSVASAIAAEQGGADRIELCSALSEDGLTPSLGLLRIVRSRVQLGLNVILRPRGGDFIYDDDEFAVMRVDLRAAKQAGCDGIVLGILTAEGRIDCVRTRQLIEEAAPLPVTFHRAFDMVADQTAALEEAIDCGAARVLSSGGKPTAMEGRENLASLQYQANGRIQMMAGGGVRQHNLHEIVAATHITALHTSLARHAPMAPEVVGPVISSVPRRKVDVEDVRRFREEFAHAVELYGTTQVQYF